MNYTEVLSHDAFPLNCTIPSDASLTAAMATGDSRIYRKLIPSPTRLSPELSIQHLVDSVLSRHARDFNGQKQAIFIGELVFITNKKL